MLPVVARFCHNCFTSCAANLHPDEVEYVLASILDTEFDTIIEDGSVAQVRPRSRILTLLQVLLITYLLIVLGNAELYCGI